MARFFEGHVLCPLLRLLQRGANPQKLGWSLAVALLIGVNPMIGSTTVAMLLLAWIFGLDYLATQIGTHTVTPLQWLLFLPFVHAGNVLFHTRRLPMSKAEVMHLSHRPLHLTHLLWRWEWHALVIWAVVAALAVAPMAALIRRMLMMAMRRYQKLPV